MKIGNHYTNNEIHDVFGGTPQRGIRFNTQTKHLTLISNLDMNTNIYPDNLNGNVLEYTGMGKHGDQSIHVAENKRLYHSNEYNYPIDLFFKMKPNFYIYVGPVKLIDTPHKEFQTNRTVIKFPLSSRSSNDIPIKSIYHKAIKYSINQISKLSTRKLENRVHIHEKKLHQYQEHSHKTTTHYYIRNPDVAQLAKRFAKGTCQLCGKRMFIDKRTGEPYLESHHIKWRSHSGPDSIKNVIALCPNCHRKMHFANNVKNDVNKLKERSIKLAEEHGFN